MGKTRRKKYLGGVIIVMDNAAPTDRIYFAPAIPFENVSLKRLVKENIITRINIGEIKGMKMKLFLVSIYLDNSLKNTYYVIADSESEASETAMKQWYEWGYSTSAYVRSVELIAEADQYGKPKVLLFKNN